jgi:hypothetical protein
MMGSAYRAVRQHTVKRHSCSKEDDVLMYYTIHAPGDQEERLKQKEGERQR